MRKRPLPTGKKKKQMNERKTGRSHNKSGGGKIFGRKTSNP